MKIVRFITGSKTSYGILQNDKIQAISGNPYGSIKTTDTYYNLADVRLLAPCKPSKVVAVGVNYRSHGEEMKHGLPEEPLIFIKPATTVIGPGDEILYPDTSERVDYEGELGVVIGKKASRVAEKDAARHILGYTCLNDVTARDIQYRDKQWTRAKGFDTFCPIGPCIETEIDPGNLALQTRLNGEVKQDTTTGYLIFGVPALVAFITRVMTLLPGDVIATGTTAGIGPMQPGDTVEVDIEGIGILRNQVAQGRR